MDPPAVCTLAADVECHVWTILQGFFLKNPEKKMFILNNKLLKHSKQVVVMNTTVIYVLGQKDSSVMTVVLTSAYKKQTCTFSCHCCL